MERDSISTPPVESGAQEPAEAPRRRTWLERIPARVKTLGGAVLVLASVAGVSWSARGRVTEYATKAEIITTAQAAETALAPVRAQVQELRERVSVNETEFRGLSKQVDRLEALVNRLEALQLAP